MGKAMNTENEILSEADEIAALLPWYVSGRISATDKARVDAYAKAHPEVIQHIALARDEADIVFADNAAIHAPRDALLRLQRSVTNSPSARLHAVQAGLIDRIGAWLGGFSPRQLAYSGVTAALVLAIQAASITSLISNSPAPGGYETASGPGSTSAAQGSFALVAFQPAAPQSTLSAFLAENGYIIVDGPKPGGVYRLRVSETTLSPTDIDAAVAKLKGRTDLVAFASIASQTP